ncbi:MAG: tetratricopeptide repeat protein [Anaerolineae bacterium]
MLFVLSLLIVTQVTVVRATLARNIGAVQLISDYAPDHLDRAERWLTYSSALSNVPASYRLLGKIQQAKGDIAGAMQIWRNAGLTTFAIDVALHELAQADPIDAGVWKQEILISISRPLEWQRLGLALETRGDYIQAVNAYQQALALLVLDTNQASLSELYYSLANLYETQLGDLPCAVEAYSMAGEVDDFQNPWHRMLSHQKLAILLMGKDNERAVVEAHRAVELMPESSMGHSILGLALYAAYGDLDQAEQEIRIAIDLDPQSVWPWMHLGQLYFQAQKYELSVAAYLKATELNPELEEARDMVVFIRKTYLEK